MKSRPFKTFFLSGCVLWLAATAAAQVAIHGKITGLVSDPTGAVIPGVTVTVEGPNLMGTRAVTTLDNGAYLFEVLPPGSYDLTFSLSGFKTALRKGIVVSAGFTATVNVSLEVGAVAETVTVLEANPVVDVKAVSTTTSFDIPLLQEIPSGRDPWSTVAQAPGATLTTYDVGGSESYQQASMSLHGSKPGQHVYAVNGLNMNWPGGNGGATAFYFDHDSLSEFQLVSDHAPAEVGVGGTYMNMVVRSGGNEVHGNVAAYYATRALNSDNIPKSLRDRGILVGLPINMARDTTVNVGGPFVRDRLWWFASYRRYDINESVLSVRRRMGGNVADINHQTDGVVRLDYSVTPKNKLNFNWLYNSQNRFFRRSTAFEFVDDQAAWRQIEPAYILMGQWVTFPTNNLAIDSRLGYLRLLFPLGYQPTVKPTDLSVADLTLSTLTGAAQNNFLNPAQHWEAASTASYFVGRPSLGTHNFRIGYEWGTYRNGNWFDANGAINVFFNNNVPLRVDLLNVPVRAKSITHQSSLFFQDAWTMRRTTINFGLRYDRFIAFNPAQRSPAGLYFPERTFARSPDLITWNNIAPRVGVAFDIFGRGHAVIKASYSRFYLIEGTRLAEAVNPNNLGGESRIWANPSGDRIPKPSEFGPVIGRFGGIVSRIDPNLKRPYSDQVGVGYEHQIYRDLRLGVQYFFRKHKRLISRRNLAVTPDQYTPVPTTNPLTGQSMAIFSQSAATVGRADFLFTNIPELNDNVYHGVEITATKRMSDRWQLLTGLTIQRYKGTFDLGLVDDFNNPNLNINRANSRLDLDATYVGKIVGTYEFPYGITTSLNYRHFTGQPVLVTNLFRNSPATPLNQGFVNVALLPRGQRRLDSVNQVDVRAGKIFRYREAVRIEALVDVFNLGNASPVTSMVTLFGPVFQRPSKILNPRLARLGLRISF
jgi:hypothetical protein